MTNETSIIQQKIKKTFGRPKKLKELKLQDKRIKKSRSQADANGNEEFVCPDNLYYEKREFSDNNATATTQIIEEKSQTKDELIEKVDQYDSSYQLLDSNQNIQNSHCFGALIEDYFKNNVNKY